MRGRIDGRWQALEAVTDPRDARGVRYPLPLPLILALLAATAGAKTFLEAAEHAADLPVWLLTELGVCSWAGTPSVRTFGRVLSRVDDDELDQAFSGWMFTDSEPAAAFAIDGKTMRAATTGQAGMPQTQVVAAMNSRGEVLGQTTVDAGDENTAARDSITRMGRKALAGTVITADAKHTSIAFITEAEKIGAFWQLPIEGNRPATYQRLKTLPWNQVRTDTHGRSRGHGRAKTRSLKVLVLDNDLRPELLGARQAIRIRRWRRPKGKPASVETVHYLTNLPPDAADADDLAKLIRGHWGIEGRLHPVRDVAFNEDRHRARTGNAPQNLADRRNAATTLHRQNGATRIQPALRAANRRPERLLHLLPETTYTGTGQLCTRPAPAPIAKITRKPSCEGKAVDATVMVS
ncbi:ISAs1 family transposase [Saccharopolyspora sp. NFXS83]|uniref:ISAs1 family transposase n=1 Tax=Saccharopolyspora sp. NFXS83 TaxID=2993560 RepID=UPI00224B5D5B|nr:ISAs1 family transposase [Saccharopolyspora sp. NFXS83]MCX2729116.1 ISAs1 family transposase [Saccharopolyspora sp. NFXS83]